MNRGDDSLNVPDVCAEWCRDQPYGAVVLDDVAQVDLDKWNRRLGVLRIPARVYAIDADGEQIESGIGYLRRGDLEASSTAIEFGPAPELARLYMCAAWMMSHRDRGGVRVIPDVRDPHRPEQPFDAVSGALVDCRCSPALVDTGAFRNWSGWPSAPGVGHPLMTLYCWAVHDAPGDRPQLLDKWSAGNLTRHGWLEAGAASQFSVHTYARYTTLVHRWARQAHTRPELIELWLNRDWLQRLAPPWIRRDVSLW